MALPLLDAEGFLPPGLHLADEAEVSRVFGAVTPARQALMRQLSGWLGRARAVEARRWAVGGSFVTAKPVPGDVDVVCWVASDFDARVQAGQTEAVQLAELNHTGQPPDFFIVLTELQWNGWMDFFSEVGDPPQRRKGVVEVRL